MIAEGIELSGMNCVHFHILCHCLVITKHRLTGDNRSDNLGV